MRLTVVPGRLLDGPTLAAWERILVERHDLASPYFRPEFTMAVASVRDDVFAIVARQDEDIVAIFPYQRRALGYGQPVAGPLSDYHDAIACREFRCDPVVLLRAAGLVCWDFDHLLRGGVFEPYVLTPRRSPVIDLSAGWDAYRVAQHATTDQLDDIARQARRLAREAGPLTVRLATTDAAVLDTLIAWKSKQYDRTGFENVFRPAWTRALLERLLAIDTPAFGGTLSALYAGGDLVAAHMGMRSHTIWHYWFPAYDARFARYSPGLILLAAMLQAAPAAGLHRIDLGKGEALYKRRLMNAEVPIAEGRVELPSITTRLRRLRRHAEDRVSQTPLAALLRQPGRLVKRLERRLRFA